MKSITTFFMYFLIFVLSTGFASAIAEEKKEGTKKEEPGYSGTLKPMEANENPLIYEGENHFKNMKQLTFEGENAEAYWSSDGAQLVLQRHVEKDGCDQIFIYDLATGKLSQISEGGVTT